MRTLSPDEMLQAWERGSERSPFDRSLTLLQCACDDQEAGHLSELPLGARDSLLFELRERTFGPEMTAVAGCPGCRTQIELRLNVADLRLPEREAPATLAISEQGYSIEFRLPRVSDFLALRDAANEAAGIQRQLLSRCILSARFSDRAVEVEELPPEIVSGVAGAMATADPQAETELSLKCVECGLEWQEPFDIESFFWMEVQAWAMRTLREVHQLAAAYGWGEKEIFKMHPRRRSLYLSLMEE